MYAYTLVRERRVEDEGLPLARACERWTRAFSRADGHSVDLVLAQFAAQRYSKVALSSLLKE